MLVSSRSLLMSLAESILSPSNHPGHTNLSGQSPSPSTSRLKTEHPIPFLNSNTHFQTIPEKKKVRKLVNMGGPASKKNDDMIAFAKTLKHTPWCDDYEKMISDMV